MLHAGPEPLPRYQGMLVSQRVSNTKGVKSAEGIGPKANGTALLPWPSVSL